MLFAACCYGKDGGNIAFLNTCLGLSCRPPNHSLELRCIFLQEEVVPKKGQPGEVVTISYPQSCQPY